VLFDPDKSNVIFSDIEGVRIMLLETLHLIAQKYESVGASFAKAVNASLKMHRAQSAPALPALSYPSISDAAQWAEAAGEPLVQTCTVRDNRHSDDSNQESRQISSHGVFPVPQMPPMPPMGFDSSSSSSSSNSNSLDLATTFDSAYFGNPLALAPSPQAMSTHMCVVGNAVLRDSSPLEGSTRAVPEGLRLSFGSAFFAGAATPTSEGAVLYSSSSCERQKASDVCLDLSVLLATNAKDSEENTPTPDEAAPIEAIGAETLVESIIGSINPGHADTLPGPARAPMAISQAIPHQQDGWDAGDNVDCGRFRAAEEATPISSTLPGSSNALFHAVRVTKDMLRSALTISQVSHKFILARTGRTLLCIDQHAADERVQLELLERKTYGDLAFGILAESCALEFPTEISFSPHELTLLELYASALEQYGFKFSVHGASSEGCSAVMIAAVPVVLGVMLSGDDMRGILHQLWEYDPSASGIQVKPKVVQYILCSKACRGAIMFGDKLDQSECSGLLANLALCELPFQCAHGRPSSTVLVDNMAVLSQHLGPGRGSEEHLGGTSQRFKRASKKPRLEKLR